MSDPAKSDAFLVPEANAAPRAAGVRRGALWLVLVAVLAWSGSIVRGGFAFDDAEAIRGNPVVAGDLPWQAAFQRDYWHHVGGAHHYRPLAALSLRADRAIHGDAAWGFHLTNVALHAVVVAIAAAVVASLAKRRWRTAALAGLLPFAAHPVLADSVAWISGRTSMISCLGGVVACLAVVRLRAPIALVPGVALGLFVGLCGKEDAIVFAPVIVAIGLARGARQAVLASAGCAVAIGGVAALRFAALGEVVPSAPVAPLGTLGLGARLVYSGRALLEGTGLLAWPFAGPPNYRGMPGFTRDVPPPMVALVGWLFWLGALAGGMWFVIRSRRRPRRASEASGFRGVTRSTLAAASAALAALAVAPVLQLIPAGEVFAPRFLYLPLLIGAPAIAIVLARIPRPALVALAVAFVLGAWMQSARYASRAAYARAVLEHAPGDVRSWNDLGIALEEEGRLEEAIEAYGEATRDPRYGRPWSNLGRIALERGAVDEAIQLLERAATRAPNQPIPYVNLGSARLRGDDPDGARAAYERAVEIAPGLAPAWRGLAQAHLAAGDEAAAREAIDEALRLDPGDADARKLDARIAR